MNELDFHYHLLGSDKFRHVLNFDAEMLLTDARTASVPHGATYLQQDARGLVIKLCAPSARGCHSGDPHFAPRVVSVALRDVFEATCVWAPGGALSSDGLVHKVASLPNFPLTGRTT